MADKITFDRIGWPLRFLGGVAAALVISAGAPTLWSVAMLAGGLAALGGRWEIVVDRERRKVHRRLGFVVPFIDRSRPLEALYSVSVGTGRRFAVNLLWRQGPRTSLRRFVKYEDAYALAEQIARHSDVPLVGGTGVKDPATLATPLRQQLIASNQVPGTLVVRAKDPYRAVEQVLEPPKPPAGCPVHIRVEDVETQRIELELPKVRSRARRFLWGIPIAGLALLGLVALFDGSPAVTGVLWLLTIPMFNQLWPAQFRVDVSPRRLTIEWNRLIGMKETSMRVSDLQEIAVVEAHDPRYAKILERLGVHSPAGERVLLLHGGGDWMLLGFGLKEEELTWLLQMLQNRIART